MAVAAVNQEGRQGDHHLPSTLAERRQTADADGQLEKEGFGLLKDAQRLNHDARLWNLS